MNSTFRRNTGIGNFTEQANREKKDQTKRNLYNESLKKIKDSCSS